jgi:hypothetical protein
MAGFFQKVEHEDGTRKVYDTVEKECAVGAQRLDHVLSG